MTTQELKNKIEKVLGNNIRCLLPSYWWKNLFHSVADRIDEVETAASDMVVKSLKEFEAKHPDMASNTLIFTEDETSAEARSNTIKLLRWAQKVTISPAKSAVNPLYIAVPIADEETAYSIQTPMYGLGAQGVKFYNLRMPDGKTYNLDFDFFSGVAKVEEASSSSGGGSVMFVADPLGNLTEEQKQNNADAFLKVLEAEGAIDINIMVMFFIAKPNMVSVNDNGDLVLVAAGIDGGASKFIFTPEGDVTIETVEPTSSGGVEIRELYIYEDISGNITELTEEQKAWNIETLELAQQNKAIVRATVNGVSFIFELFNKYNEYSFGYTQFSPSGGMAISAAIHENGIAVLKLEHSNFDTSLSTSSINAVQNKVVSAAINDINERLNNIGGGGSNIVVDTEMSSTSTNPVQNKVVYSELQKKQGTISDLADIRSGAALGKTALQSVPSEYVTESELTEKGYATTSQVNDKQDRIDDLEEIRSGAAKGATALQSEQYKGTVTGVKINGTTKNPSSGVVDLGTVITAHQDISHLATKEELNSLTNEIISNERVHAASLVDIDARIQDILTRLNNAGL